MLGTIDLKIKLEAKLTQDGEDWVACCPPLDLYTQAESKDAAMAALKEAVFAWFESCLERRVLAKALEEVGFKLAKAGEAIPDHANIVHASPTHADACMGPSVKWAEEVEVSIPAYIAAAMSSSTHASC